MIRFGALVLALVGYFSSSMPCLAQVSIQAPFVRVETGGPGGGVFVKAPFVSVDVPPSYPVYQPAPVYQPSPVVQPNAAPPVVSEPPGSPKIQTIIPPQQPPQLPTPQPLPVVPVQPQLFVFKEPITHKQFAKLFQPLPGTYKVNFIHPGICKDVVCVCFTLPPGCPRVHCGHRYLEFDYGSCEVEIRFALFGKVRVNYDD